MKIIIDIILTRYICISDFVSAMIWRWNVVYVRLYSWFVWVMDKIHWRVILKEIPSRRFPLAFAAAKNDGWKHFAIFIIGGSLSAKATQLWQRLIRPGRTPLAVLSSFPYAGLLRPTVLTLLYPGQIIFIFGGIIRWRGPPFLFPPPAGSETLKGPAC